MDKKPDLDLLLLKLENLLLRQQGFEQEIRQLKSDIQTLQQGKTPSVKAVAIETEKAMPVTPITTLPKPNIPLVKKPIPEWKKNIENFVAENILSKIGLLILVIGVGIGTKFAIDHQLINPLTRIILGYGVGLVLLVLAFRLKKNYLNFSALLLSGAVAILYFITFFAYAYYALIPQGLAFAFMLVFTAFTVFAALKYNLQIIAHYGLVGAYAVPFLLSDGSGQTLILLSYIVVVNLGVLWVCFFKQWKALLYSALGFTWLIFLVSLDYGLHKQPYVGLAFNTLYFLIFYASIIAYKIKQDIDLRRGDVVLILVNAVVFYALGLYIILNHEVLSDYAGLFTIGNAIVHFAVSQLVYRKKSSHIQLFYFSLALVIAFITIAIPVQLEGKWISLFWVIEASLLFYIGTSKQLALYRKMAYPLILIAFFKLSIDWAFIDDRNARYLPFLNLSFLNHVIALVGFSYMSWQVQKPFNFSGLWAKVEQIFKYILPLFTILILYHMFKVEIHYIFAQLIHKSEIKLRNASYTDSNYYDLRNITVVMYGLLLSAALLTAYRLKIQSIKLFPVVLVCFTLISLYYIDYGNFILNDLRDNYLEQRIPYFKTPIWNIVMRYLAALCFIVFLLSFKKLLHALPLSKKLYTIGQYLFHISLLILLSLELYNLIIYFGLGARYEVSLSILWGLYALFMVMWGIYKKEQFLRVGAIVLFGITLIKLFFVDIHHMNTLAKTIIFVSLGIILLSISFLYNKFKLLIEDEKDH